MKLKALLIMFLIVTAVGCIGEKIDTTKPPVEFKAVVAQGELNQSIGSVYPILLEVHRTYFLTWNNTSIDISERVPLLFVKMKNDSWLIGAQEIDGNVFLLHPETDGEGRLYSCHCPEGKIIDFKVLANIHAFHTIRSFHVNYEVKRLGSNEYILITTGYSAEKLRIFGKTYTMILGELNGKWGSNDLTIEPLGNHTYRVRIMEKQKSGVKVTLSVIPIVLTGGKENVTLTTIPLDISAVEKR